MKPVITKNEARERIAGHVNIRLEQHEMSQSELSRRSMVSHPRITLLCRGELLPNPADLWNVAEALGTTLDGLLEPLPELAKH